MPFSLAMHLKLISFAFWDFGILTSESSGWNDLLNLMSLSTCPCGFLSSRYLCEQRNQVRARLQQQGEAGCKGEMAAGVHPWIRGLLPLMGWRWLQAYLHGKKFPSNYTAVLWWLRSIMGMLCSQSSLIHKFHLPLAIFFPWIDQYFCGSLYHSHTSKSE